MKYRIVITLDNIRCYLCLDPDKPLWIEDITQATPLIYTDALNWLKREAKNFPQCVNQGLLGIEKIS